MREGDERRSLVSGKRKKKYVEIFITKKTIAAGYFYWRVFSLRCSCGRVRERALATYGPPLCSVASEILYARGGYGRAPTIDNHTKRRLIIAGEGVTNEEPDRSLRREERNKAHLGRRWM